MRVVCDIECNGLVAPDKIWLIVCKDVDTGLVAIFRNPTTNPLEKERFLEYANSVDIWVGHNFLGYDAHQLSRLIGFDDTDIASRCVDTLVVSKMVDYSRAEGHSVEAYGVEFGYEKGKFTAWKDEELLDAGSLLFRQLEDYCLRDVEITLKVLLKYTKDIAYLSLSTANSNITTLKHKDYYSITIGSPLHTEQAFQYLVINRLENKGFGFNTDKANDLLSKVSEELKELDDEIKTAFPPKEVVVRTFTPRATKHGTISRTSVPRSLWPVIHTFVIGCEYPLTRLVEFNPASHKQIIKVLNEAGWQPEDKTQTHIDTERELNRLKYQKNKSEEVDLRIQMLHTKLLTMQQSGWKINENNLDTLPKTAPPAARLLAKRILLESRRRTLTEWLGLVQEDHRIHGKFYGIGAWTHRMAHQKPNTANIPNELETSGKKKLLGKELRSLWRAPRNRLLVGVDAEGIQLRIFAHYIKDPEFTDALVKGKKDDKTDPHSLNQRILGDVCKSRQAAKRFVFALLLGGGVGKLSQILECDRGQTEEALDRLLQRYTGFAYLKKEIIPKDASRGYFIGLDGRKTTIPGETVSARKHLCMSGYLQNGEAIIMKSASLKWIDKLEDFDSFLVDLVHDEWQTETPNNQETAIQVAKMQADSLYEVGLDLNLNCPLAGSYWNDDKKDYTIGTNWYQTH